MSLTIINRKNRKEISQRKIETYEKYNEVIQWGRRKPIDFCSRFMGVELLDLQKYCITETWFSEFAIWLRCRNGGKTTDGAVYAMLRSLLFPFHATYFLGNTGEQAKETFKKLEKIAKKEIESFAGCTDVFTDEVRKSGTQGDGFVHDSASFKVELFNGSAVYTLNSDITNIKGKRANLVYFDEAGWFTDELFIQAEQFTNQSENFKLGAGIDLALEPLGFPRQLVYGSSASDESSEFYKKYRSFAKEMLMGNRKYFVCDFDVDMILKAKYNGEKYPPLISRDKVEKALAENPEKAKRELYNEFSADSFQNQILTRRELKACTVNRPPLLENDTGNRLFVISWDSARLNDNSVIEIGEIRTDPKKGLCLDLHNIVSLVDVKTRNKIPMRMPEQVKRFKELLLKYNGTDKKKLDYENIKMVVCDSGSGGQMVGGVADYLLENWVDKFGVIHKGLIDKNHKSSETARREFPDACDKLKLVDPKGNRNAIFDAIEQMVKLGVVTFPAEYTDKDYLVTINDSGEEERHELTHEEQVSLAQIELLKTEIVTMCKYENKGAISYDLDITKRRIMHDDRVFAFGLMCYWFAGLRRGEVINSPKPKRDLSHMPKCVSRLDF